MSAKKTKKVAIFNGGKRTFTLADGELFKPSEGVNVAPALAKKLMDMYPAEITVPSGKVEIVDTSELEAVVVGLKTEVETLKGDKEDLIETVTDLESQIVTLKSDLDAATAPATA